MDLLDRYISTTAEITKKEDTGTLLVPLFTVADLGEGSGGPAFPPPPNILVKNTEMTEGKTPAAQVHQIPVNMSVCVSPRPPIPSPLSSRPGSTTALLMSRTDRADIFHCVIYFSLRDQAISGPFLFRTILCIQLSNMDLSPIGRVYVSHQQSTQDISQHLRSTADAKHHLQNKFLCWLKWLINQPNQVFFPNIKSKKKTTTTNRKQFIPTQPGLQCDLSHGNYNKMFCAVHYKRTLELGVPVVPLHLLTRPPPPLPFRVNKPVDIVAVQSHYIIMLIYMFDKN